MKKAKAEKKNVQIKKDTLKQLATEDLESGSVVGATNALGASSTARRSSRGLFRVF